MPNNVKMRPFKRSGKRIERREPPPEVKELNELLGNIARIITTLRELDAEVGAIEEKLQTLRWRYRRHLGLHGRFATLEETERARQAEAGPPAAPRTPGPATTSYPVIYSQAANTLQKKKADIERVMEGLRSRDLVDGWVKLMEFRDVQREVPDSRIGNLTREDLVRMMNEIRTTQEHKDRMMKLMGRMLARLGMRRDPNAEEATQS